WGARREGALLTPSKLQAVEVPVVDRDECSAAYEQYGGVTASMLCAGVPEGGKDACQGDSGGPVVAGGQLVGLVSWGVGCARAGFPGVNADVAALSDWVLETTGI
ncbi:Trypsin-1, partial [Gryllus bimaculatus]